MRFYHRLIPPKDTDGMENSVDPDHSADQTAPSRFAKTVRKLGIITVIEPCHDKTNKMSVSSEDSDQPGHSPSLISLHCVLNG